MSIWEIGVIALATLAAAKADTVTTNDSRSWNGTITIQGGVLKLQASFPGGKAVPLQFGADYIRAIEFNATTYNPGVLPKLPRAKSGTLSGTAYTRDKKANVCRDITVDKTRVNCDGKSLDRQSVMRILVRGGVALK